MSSSLKRELLFWLASAATIGAYLAAGHLSAPDVLPKLQSSPSPDGPVSLQTALDAIRKDNQAQQDWKRSVNDHNSFLRSWYRWGAVAGIVLVLAYTWWRPPWRMTVPEQSVRETARRSSPRTALPISRHLLIGLIVMLSLATAAVLAAVFFST